MQTYKALDARDPRKKSDTTQSACLQTSVSYQCAREFLLTNNYCSIQELAKLQKRKCENICQTKKQGPSYLIENADTRRASQSHLGL